MSTDFIMAKFSSMVSSDDIAGIIRSLASIAPGAKVININGGDGHIASVEMSVDNQYKQQIIAKLNDEPAVISCHPVGWYAK